MKRRVSGETTPLKLNSKILTQIKNQHPLNNHLHDFSFRLHILLDFFCYKYFDLKKTQLLADDYVKNYSEGDPVKKEPGEEQKCRLRRMCC